MLREGHDSVWLSYGNCLSSIDERAEDAEAAYRQPLAHGDDDAHLNLGHISATRGATTRPRLSSAAHSRPATITARMPYAVYLLDAERDDEVREHLTVAASEGNEDARQILAERFRYERQDWTKGSRPGATRRCGCRSRSSPPDRRSPTSPAAAIPQAGRRDG